MAHCNRPAGERPLAADADDADAAVETGKAMVDYAQQLDIRTEYSFYRAPLENPDPQKKILLAEALEKRNPDSRHLPQMAEQWISAYQRTGNRDRADKALRAAIPLVKDNDQLLADAGGFFEQCAKIKSPYQGQAQKNVKAIRGK